MALAVTCVASEAEETRRAFASPGSSAAPWSNRRVNGLRTQASTVAAWVGPSHASLSQAGRRFSANARLPSSASAELMHSTYSSSVTGGRVSLIMRL
jgi:hypothetical protein